MFPEAAITPLMRKQLLTAVYPVMHCTVAIALCCMTYSWLFVVYMVRKEGYGLRWSDYEQWFYD